MSKWKETRRRRAIKRERAGMLLKTHGDAVRFVEANLADWFKEPATVEPGVVALVADWLWTTRRDAPETVTAETVSSLLDLAKAHALDEAAEFRAAALNPFVGADLRDGKPVVLGQPLPDRRRTRAFYSGFLKT